MYSLSHPFPGYFQILSPIPTHIYIPAFYVPMYFTYLCAYRSSCFTCPCAYVVHFYAFYCLCLYTLRAFVCVNRSGPFIYIAFFKKILVISVLFLLWYQYLFSSCLFSSHGFSAHVFQWFHLFDVVRAQTYLGPKKWIFWKLYWFFFKRLSWTFTISTFYLEMDLLDHIQPTLTHIRLQERKVKKYIRPLLLSY